MAPFFDQGRKDAKPLCALSVYRQVLEPILAAKIVIFADIGKFIRGFLLGMMAWCKGIVPKFNTSERGVLGDGWERQRARSKQTRRS